MLSRFPGATIVAYDQRYHDIAFLPSAPSKRNGFTKGDWVKGRLSWIVYQGPANRSTLEIYKNYENALKEAGFVIGYSCKKDACGYSFINHMLDITGRMVGGGERWMPNTARYLAARLSRDDGDAWVSLMVYERNANGVAAIRLEVIEANSPRSLEVLVARQVGTKSLNYDEIRVASGKVVSNKLQDVLDLEGEIQWRAFAFDRTASAYEVFASYRKFMEDQGYIIQFKCHFEFCGSSFIRKVVDLNGNIISGGERWSGDSAHYFMAKLVSPQKLAYVSLLAYKQPNGLAISRMLKVVPQDIEFNLITVTGESMADEIEKTGKVAVYGIYFDTDSAEIKTKSGDTMAEIARLLELKPELSLYVDGHTDSEGSDEYNNDLSGRRASAVVLALVEQHGIAKQRLEARGFGESQPVASNDTEEGRTWNRRVELVAR
jgi:outer membrane protein OmpA-like peptidoglycan-associated protein